MTKLLILSDSHGGRAAIERILKQKANNIDALIFLGDGLRDLEQALTLTPSCGPTPWPATAITARWSRWTGWPPFDQRGRFLYPRSHVRRKIRSGYAGGCRRRPRGRGGAVRPHPHSPSQRQRGGVLFNPGSCGRCYTGPDTYGILTLDNGKVDRL